MVLMLSSKYCSLIKILINPGGNTSILDIISLWILFLILFAMFIGLSFKDLAKDKAILVE